MFAAIPCSESASNRPQRCAIARNVCTTREPEGYFEVSKNNTGKYSRVFETNEIGVCQADSRYQGMPVNVILQSLLRFPFSIGNNIVIRMKSIFQEVIACNRLSFLYRIP